MRLTLPIQSLDTLHELTQYIQSVSPRNNQNQNILIYSQNSNSLESWTNIRPGLEMFPDLQIKQELISTSDVLSLSEVTVMLNDPRGRMYFLSLEIKPLQILTEKLWGLNQLKNRQWILDAARELCNQMMGENIGELKLLPDQDLQASLPWSWFTKGIRLVPQQASLSYQEIAGKGGIQFRIIQIV